MHIDRSRIVLLLKKLNGQVSALSFCSEHDVLSFNWSLVLQTVTDEAQQSLLSHILHLLLPFVEDRREIIAPVLCRTLKDREWGLAFKSVCHEAQPGESGWTKREERKAFPWGDTEFVALKEKENRSSDSILLSFRKKKVFYKGMKMKRTDKNN